ncbi:hypothetical protein [Fusobacterium sp. PH5-44]|uniref:hypothetical protein n=1 Tax=unclassified Fusobacterium TaxID=2648384 RepID=UPI003D1CC384
MKKLKYLFIIILLIIINSLNLFGKKGAPLKKGVTTIAHKGIYKLEVPGEWREDLGVGVGIQGMQHGFWYYTMKASIIGGISTINAKEKEGLKTWGRSQKWMEEYGKVIFGDEISEIKVYPKFKDGMSFKLKRKNTEFFVRVTYKVTKNYVAEFIGFSQLTQDNEKLAKNTIATAKSFVEHGSPKDNRYNKNKEMNGSQWKFHGTYDPFLIVKYYFDRAERPEPSESRKATDYVIKWKSKDFGILIGKMLKKNPNEIKSSDLDHIKKFRCWNNREEETHYSIGMNDLNYNIPKTGINFNDFADFEEFKNLEDLLLMFDDYKDIKPIWKLTKLKKLMFAPNEKIRSLKGIEKLVNLEEAYFFNEEFSDKLTDLRPLEKLSNLESLHIRVPGVKDLSPLLKLKNLRGVEIYCNESANHQVLIDAEKIRRLEINRKKYK